MKRSLMVVAGALVALMPVTLAVPAFASANPAASCNGIGGSTETMLDGPGARADIAHEVKNVIAMESGTTPGGVMSGFAQLHLGSGDACFG
jgi:hypothetical protein